MSRKFLVLLLSLLMFMPAAQAATIVKPYTFTAGTTIQSAQVNSDFDTIYNDYNGGITNANISTSAAVNFSKMDLTSLLGPLLRAAAANCITVGTTGDTQPRFAVTADGFLKFGPGVATAVDTILKRTAVGKLAVRNSADAANADFDAATGTFSTATTTPLVKLLNGSHLNIAAAAIAADRTITAQDPLAAAALRFTTGTFNAGGVVYNDGNNLLSSAAGTAEQVAVSGGTGSPVFRTMNAAPGGRLTLASGVAVSPSDVTAAGTIYYTPYLSKTAWLKVGSVWQLHQVAEVSLALTATSGSVYDVFLYSNAGTPTLETLVWTNPTTRATAIASDADTGLMVKSGDATRLYVGTFYATAANQTEDSAARRVLWNAYNRVPRRLYAADGTNTWVYNTATWRPTNNSTVDGVGRFAFVLGIAGAQVWATNHAGLIVSAAATPSAGIAMDSTTAPDSKLPNTGAAGFRVGMTVSHNWTPSVGYHFVNGLELGNAAATCTWSGDDGAEPLHHLIGGIEN